MAFIAEQAGGKAINGIGRTFDILPTSIHQRTSLVMGGHSEVDVFEAIRDA